MQGKTEARSCRGSKATCAHDKESIVQNYLRSWRSLGALALAGMLFAAAVPAQAAVYVRIAPPAPQAEVVGPPPTPGCAWTGGYYRWDGRKYVWQPGRWVDGHWRQTRRGWTWVPGHWRG